jgi:hypothetical protein
LNKRYSKQEIRSAAVHPGFVASNLYKDTPLSFLAPYLFIKTSDGALASLYCATSSEIETKDTWWVGLFPVLMHFIANDQSWAFSLHRDVYRGDFAQVQHDSAYSKDEKLQQDLWNLSEALIRPSWNVLYTLVVPHSRLASLAR